MLRNFLHSYWFYLKLAWKFYRHRCFVERWNKTFNTAFLAVLDEYAMLYRPNHEKSVWEDDTRN